MPQAHLPQAHLAQQGQHHNAQHAQQIFAQQLAMQQHQAHQQANSQMHPGGQPGHSGPMSQQHMQSLQQAQIAQSMAQQASQGPQGQGPQSQPQPPGQPQPQGQPSQPGQPQPGQPQPGPQPGPQPQPNPQGPQRAPTPAGVQPNQPQNQGPNPVQGNQPQQPQGQGQSLNGQQGQPQQPTAQMLQVSHNQQQLANNLHQLQHKNDGMKGHCLLKLLQFGEHLSGYPGSRSKDDLTYWNGFVTQFFSPRGVFRLSLFYIGNEPANEEHADKQYEITQPALARYFHTHFESGIRRINLTFEKGITDRPLPNGCHFIENQKASLTYWFDNSHVVATGSLRAQFDSDQKLELLEFITQSHEEYHSRKMVIEAAKPAHLWVKQWRKVNGQDTRSSPEMSKKGKKSLKSPAYAPPDIDLPVSAVKQNIGITEAVFQFLEIIEVVGQMNPLFNFYHAHPNLSPYGALEQYVSQNITNGPQQPGVNGQAQANGPPNPRTPNFNQFPMGASPAATHLQLPNSPHLGSPAQGHMQAPGMQLQQSQQGTSSSGPSANTSPASNKRRRPSTVKTEEESGAPTPASIGGPQVNGVVTIAGKKPPTPRLQKRLKGNPA
ncbi:LIM-domain binding protein-domain-containing protein [Durotheca rogersii]|uniref:LIM-domain binding protein-domain-containing protein n=1 Tax=Durotheca rogersii TaxID=419775 RepID=UPI00221FA97A|nr:LIM-domain binding protein-domain-containing protein [Durotheca rogersii]KAI5855537.1 LIM-domain binding protein-domain-containing protein [Durotheca rogersii]